MKNKTRACRSRTVENITAVAESVAENPGLSIPRRSLELGIPQMLLHRILHEDLGLEAYKIQLTQELDLFCGISFWTVLSLEEVITIGHRDLVILPLATSSLGPRETEGLRQ